MKNSSYIGFTRVTVRLQQTAMQTCKKNTREDIQMCFKVLLIYKHTGYEKVEQLGEDTPLPSSTNCNRIQIAFNEEGIRSRPMETLQIQKPIAEAQLLLNSTHSALERTLNSHTCHYIIFTGSLQTLNVLFLQLSFHPDAGYYTSTTILPLHTEIHIQCVSLCIWASPHMPHSFVMQSEYLLCNL